MLATSVREESAVRMSSLGEFGFIDTIRAKTGDQGGFVRKGIGDDAAVLDMPPAGKQLLWTVDMLVEGVHFELSYTTPRLLGRKSLSVNLSDIAAMGGEPLACLMSVGLPGDTDAGLATGFVDGFLEVARERACPLAGGDTVAAPGVVIDVTVLGLAPAGRAFLRSGARPGQLILVTGALGSSAAGLAVLRRGLDSQAVWAPLVCAHLDPTPRLDEAAAAREAGGVGAMMDISDGLASEVNHICRESGVGAVIWSESIPVSAATREFCAKAEISDLDLALLGGEDYELVFTAGKQDATHIAEAIEARTGTPVTVVGEVRDAAKGVKISTGAVERDLLPAAYDHFRTKARLLAPTAPAGQSSSQQKQLMHFARSTSGMPSRKTIA